MLLCACSNDTTQSTDGTAAQTETSPVETEEVWSGLPNMDWDCRVFYVLGKETSNASFNTFEVYAESTNGEILNDTIFERNTSIENKYNVKIGCTAVEDTSAELRKVVMANEDRFSLIGGATKDMAMFAASLANKIVSKDENGDLHISMNTEHMVNSIDKIHALYDKSCSAYPEDFSKYDSADFYNYGYNIFILETHFFLHLF